MSIRGAVQDCFTALLTSTARPTLPTDGVTVPSAQPHPSFLVILRAFLTRAAYSSPSLSDLRAVLGEIFQAYAFEERILNLANQFLDKDLFENVEDAWTLRQKGWRPRGNVCELCGKRVWGPGVGGGVWDQWEADSGRRERQQQLKRTVSSISENGGVHDRGKGKSPTTPSADMTLDTRSPDSDSDIPSTEQSRKSGDSARTIVVFACRHLWHRDCLEQTLEASGQAGDANRELKCPADHPDSR